MYQLYTAENLNGVNLSSAKPVSEQTQAQTIGQPLRLEEARYWMVRAEKMEFIAWFEPVRMEEAV